MAIDYRIGSLAGGPAGMSTLLALVGCWPENNFEPWSSDYWRSTGATYGQGFPKDSWTFRGMSQAGVQALRTLCPSKSAQIYVRTRTDDDDTFKTFTAWMHWNRQAQRSRLWNGTYQELVIDLTTLEEVT